MNAIPGIRIGTAAAEIRYKGRDDLALIDCGDGSVVAAVFTTNAFCAAPVTVAKNHLAQAMPRYLLINAGNANAGTGPDGLVAAESTCQMVANHFGCEAAEVLPFSTGVIGMALPVERFPAGIAAAGATFEEAGWDRLAAAIMTTDTVPKLESEAFEVNGIRYTVTGVAKGAGMIRPNMATMLSYIGTDAPLTREQADAALRRAVARTLNRVTVDGDTSTNDACVLVATGRAGGSASDAILEAFTAALTLVTERLAMDIARDGEGATRLVVVAVTGGRDEAECEKVAFTVAESPLVKTALYAADPNWGRILAAVGRSGVDALDVTGVDLALGPVSVLTGGAPTPGYVEADASAFLAGTEVTLNIALGRGDASARVYTCDFSEEYVRINADYRS